MCVIIIDSLEKSFAYSNLHSTPNRSLPQETPTIKNGDNNNNQEMLMREQLLVNQTHLNQMTTQFLANNNGLDPTIQKFLEI